MISRVWRGWAATATDADRYERHYRDDVLPELRAIAGFREAKLLRHLDADGVTEFLSLVDFDDLEAIRAFAGADPEAAVVAAEARTALLRWQERVTHYEVAALPGARAPKSVS